MYLSRPHFRGSRGFIAALVLASLLATTPVAAAPRAKGIFGGVIVVGRGVAGARLGMTRAQVIERIGPPVREMPNRGMSYEPLPPKNPHGQFDIALQGGHVRMFIISPRSTWHLANGIHIFASGAVARLMRCYGRRLKPTRIEDGERVYRITEHFLGRTVWTEFYVEHFGPRAIVYGFDLLFPLTRNLSVGMTALPSKRPSPKVRELMS